LGRWRGSGDAEEIDYMVAVLVVVCIGLLVAVIVTRT
jgi:hypothetical protein